jgi:hypothetical protein
MTLAQAIAPAWFVLPLSALALLVVAGHWVALGRADMPMTRKRLRSANGLVMLFSIPVLAYSFGIADTAQPRRFVLAWMLSAGLLVIVLALAGLDLLYTLRLALAERRSFRAEFRDARRAGTPATGHADAQTPRDATQ